MTYEVEITYQLQWFSKTFEEWRNLLDPFSTLELAKTELSKRLSDEDDKDVVWRNAKSYCKILTGRKTFARQKMSFQ